jgi:hypothetical protein
LSYTAGSGFDGYPGVGFLAGSAPRLFGGGGGGGGAATNSGSGGPIVAFGGRGNFFGGGGGGGGAVTNGSAFTSNGGQFGAPGLAIIITYFS